MASLGGAGESVAVVVAEGELGSATATLLARAGFTVVPADRTPKALDELAEGIRREVGDTTDQPRVFPAEVLARAVRPEAAADIIAFLVNDPAAGVRRLILFARCRSRYTRTEPGDGPAGLD